MVGPSRQMSCWSWISLTSYHPLTVSHEQIIKIFCTNREKLVAYLGNFHNDRDDEQFREEKSLLISTLMKLEYKERKCPWPPPVLSLSPPHPSSSECCHLMITGGCSCRRGYLWAVIT